MPLARYFLYVGGALLALLFISDPYLPKLPAADWGNSRSAVIHIHSDQKWPERIDYDTSLLTVPPSQIANIEANVAAPEIVASTTEREAFAQLQPSSRYPMSKKANRSCNANARLQRDAPPRLHSWQRDKCNLAGLAIAFGERLDGSYNFVGARGIVEPFSTFVLRQGPSVGPPTRPSGSAMVSRPPLSSEDPA